MLSQRVTDINAGGVVAAGTRAARVVGLHKDRCKFEHAVVKIQVLDCTDSVIELEKGAIAKIEVFRCARCRIVVKRGGCGIHVEKSTMCVVEVPNVTKLFTLTSPGLSVQLEADPMCIETYNVPETQDLAVTTFSDAEGFITKVTNAFGDDALQTTVLDEDDYRRPEDNDEETLERRLWKITRRMGPVTGADRKLPCELRKDLFLSNAQGVSDIPKLQKLGITHVLNLAARETIEIGYQTAGLTYLGIDADDAPNYDIMKHFDAALTFYHEASQKNGALVVHCVAGVNRSGAIATALYMRISNSGLLDAATHINNIRGHYLTNVTFRRDLAKWASDDDDEK